MTNVCGDIDTVRWIEPDHVPISMAFRFRWLAVVLEVVIETAFFFRASWYGEAAESKDRLSDDMFDSLLLMASGKPRTIEGGWLLS